MGHAPASNRSAHGLPASKEVLLEIQVNKLIHKFLFNSPAPENYKGLPDSKENAIHPQHPTSLLSTLQHSDCSLACSPSNQIRDGPCFCASSWCSPREANGAQAASLVSLSGAAPSRNETLPRSSESTDVKHSFRKPPRPPLPPPLAAAKLGRCTSDTVLLLQTRRPRTDRKRRVLASANASTWALIFTLCFAVAILGQGFWSQGNRGMPVEVKNEGAASSPSTNFGRTSAPSSSAGVSERKIKVYSASYTTRAGEHPEVYTRRIGGHDVS